MTNEDAMAIYERTKRDKEEEQQSLPPSYTQEELEYQARVGANTKSHDNDDIEEVNGSYVINDNSFWEEMNNGGLQENLVPPQQSFDSFNEVIEIEDNNLWEQLEREKQERAQQTANIPDDSIMDSRGKNIQTNSLINNDEDINVLTPEQIKFAKEKDNKIEQNFYHKKAYPIEIDNTGKVTKWGNYLSKNGKSSMKASLDGDRTETTRSVSEIESIKKIAKNQGIKNGITGTIVWMEGQVDNIKNSNNVVGGWFKITSEPYTPNENDFNKYENWMPEVWNNRNEYFKLGTSYEWKSVRFEKINSGQKTSQSKVENIVSTPGYIKDSAKKHLSKELFKIRKATQFIGTGGGNDSTTQRMEDAYKQVGASNTGIYTDSDIIYVSSNGKRSNRFNPIVDDKLQGAYKNIDLAIAAGAKFIMDVKSHLDNTMSYNIGEIQLQNYLNSHDYSRDDMTGIWSPNNKSSIKPQQSTETIDNQKVTKYPQITNFYNSLTAEQKKKINSLNELIRDYNQIPFEYSEEDFIEDLKCELRFKM
jgi:hypothetical protein